MNNYLSDISNKKISSWKQISSQMEYCYQPWIKVMKDVVKLPSGRIIDDYFRIDLPNYVAIYAQCNDGKILLQRQYKYALNEVVLTLPTGCIEKNEKPIDTAKREFLEETGYIANSWTSVGKFISDGNKGCGFAHYFLAEDIEKKTEPVEDDMEETDIVFLTLDKLFYLISKNMIPLLSTVSLISIASNKKLLKQLKNEK